jgi:hypothetical protein
LLQTRPHAASFAELLGARADLLRAHGKRWVHEQEQTAQELLTALELLASRSELNATPRWVEEAPTAAAEVLRAAVITERIRMKRAVRDREVLYFYLYSHAEEALTRYIASFALEAFYAAVTLHNRARPPAERLQSYVFIDEFQQVAGRNFENFMVQARSSGVALILANQTRAQLDPTLQHAVANTGFRQFFDFQEPADLAYIADLAGETLERSSVDPEEQTYAKRIRASDMSPLSAQRDTSLVRLKANVDYAVFDGFPFPIRSLHPLSLAETTRFAACPLPTDVAGTMRLEDESLPVAPVPRPTVGVTAAPPPDAGLQATALFIRPTPSDPALAALFARIAPVGDPHPDHYVTEAAEPADDPTEAG